MAIGNSSSWLKKIGMPGWLPKEDPFVQDSLNQAMAQQAAQALNQALNQAQVNFAHQAVQAQGYAPQMAQQQYEPKPSYHQEARHPLNQKVQNAIAHVIKALPYRVVERIEAIRFGPQSVVDPQFEVVFKGNADPVLFDNIDSFPTEADIARICLMCP